MNIIGFIIAGAITIWLVVTFSDIKVYDDFDE
jgi:hypothetical protein